MTSCPSRSGLVGVNAAQMVPRMCRREDVAHEGAARVLDSARAEAFREPSEALAERGDAEPASSILAGPSVRLGLDLQYPDPVINRPRVVRRYSLATS
jgi:hypothetical protein